MRTIIITAALALATIVNTAAIAGSYRDALKACGEEWRASEQRKGVKKGEGAEAWRAFRTECTRRIGWQIAAPRARGTPKADSNT